MNVFKRLLRANASPIDHSPGIDELSPPLHLNDQYQQIARDHVVNNLNGRPVTYFYGDVRNPFRLPQRPAIPPEPTPTTRTAADYGRARHGEGLWGVEPLVPEGRTRA